MTDTHRQFQNATAQRDAQGEIRRVDVQEILGERREAVLVHAGNEYRLRITASGKLILTK